MKGKRCGVLRVPSKCGVATGYMVNKVFWSDLCHYFVISDGHFEMKSNGFPGGLDGMKNTTCSVKITKTHVPASPGGV